MIDFQKLGHDEFETLVGLILKREGHEIIHGPGAPGTRGPDYETVSPEGRVTIVDVKHFRNGVGKSQIMQFAGDLDRYHQQNSGVQGLLVLSSALAATAIESIADRPDIVVWDRDAVAARLVRDKDLESIFRSMIEAKHSFESQLKNLLENSTSRANELSRRLKALPPGREDWRAYENICTEILTYVFSPDLGMPDIQCRSDDNLDIIDAIFPIRSNCHPWSLVRSEYRTRFVVAEFKNYSDPIGQAQVESIAQYLWRPAQRFFGILVSRSDPSAGAIAQRRRKWLEEEKCIVFLSDDELCEMLSLREMNSQPFDVIDAQLEDFFRTLTP